ELFLEYRQAESLVFDDGKLKSVAFDTTEGFGLRAVAGETTAYAHSSEISEAALKRAAGTVKSVTRGRAGMIALPPQKTNRKLYSDANPIGAMDFAAKVKLIRDADAFARALDSRVRQVSISLSGEWQLVEIMRPDGFAARDIRPLVRFNVSVVTGSGERQESGSYGMGGRSSYVSFLSEENWQAAVQEALRQSLVALESVAAPAGEMDVVLGPGWPGILLHEAIGHGLEGDFNRKKTSAFSGLMGRRIAAEGITVVDDGTIESRRGSLSFDDEGTPTNRTVLIENGKLVGYMQDRLNARLMGVKPTGNGRRQSFAHSPMPRMTNTIMLSGEKVPAEIIASVDRGLYAVNFGGGQVDITSGKFVFSCTEAYKIEKGKIGAPVKGAMIIGSGADALTRISMVGNDMKLDSGIGTCGKQGQGVPVGVGQPTLRLDKITVGGTAA
ncbi:MAG TPA: metalloprotease TldD, partial [Aestuariivirgaceae bacterium]|nr:metalloprotease TldD [Aestuariivirgaceae bacterium]